MKKNNCPCNEKIIKDELLAKKKGYNLPILTVNLKRIKTIRNLKNRCENE